MIYDIKDFTTVLEKYISLQKKIDFIEQRATILEMKMLPKMKIQLSKYHEQVEKLRKNYEDPENLQKYFSGCAFVTFKTQAILQKVINHLPQK